MNAKLTTKEAAAAVAISRITLQRWLSADKLRRAPKLVVGNDGRAIRLWSAADIAALRKLKEETYRQGQGRRNDRVAAQEKNGNR